MNKNKDSKKTIQTALLNTIANAFSLVIGMVMIPIIARVLTTTEMGVASTFISTRNTFVIVATLSVYAYVHKAMLEFKDNKKNYIWSIAIFCAIALCVVFGVCLPFKSHIMKILSLDNFLFYWLFVSAFVFALYSIGNYYCIFHNKSLIVFAIVLAVGPISQFLSYGLAFVFSDRKYIGRVLGLDFVYCIVALCVVVWLLVSKNKKPAWKYVRQTLKFTVPIIPHLLSQMVLTQCDLIMISYFAGEDKTGIYSMGHTVGFLAFTVMSQIMAAWSPWVYRRLEEADRESIYKNAKIMMLLGTFMSIGLLTVGTELIRIFLPSDYSPCVYIIPPLVLAMYFQFVYLFFYDLEYYYKKSKWIATASVIASILNVLLNLYCIPRFGYIAASYTTLASYLVLLVLNYLFCLKLGVRKTYNIFVVLGLTGAVIVYMGFVFMTINLPVVRYVVLVIISMILLITQWKNLKSLLKLVRG